VRLSCLSRAPRILAIGNPTTLVLYSRWRLWYYISGNVMGSSMEPAMESAITMKGQATIPKAIRDHLGLKPGDRLKFFFHPDGTVVLLPKLPARSLRGMVRSRRRKTVTIDQMTGAIAAGASGRTARTKRR
jgi:AbrB family looped-hinge helix DNA binding protein